MAKILFLQPDATEYIGVMSISGLLKSEGITPGIFIGRDKARILEFIKDYRPKIVAFSCMTPQAPWVIEIAGFIKENYNSCLTIVGGPHPTFMPEMIENPVIDIICRGEGEYAMLELSKAVKEDRDIRFIPNLWVKQNGQIYRNDVRNFIEDLDMLPLPDREIYYSRYHFLSYHPFKIFITSRGCPFLCSFCYNNIVFQIYNSKGKYIRRKSPLRTIEEIKDVRDRYKLKTVIFADDIFSLDKKWLSAFFKLYIDEINLPFNCNIRVDAINEEVIKMLKKAGCYSVNFGIESGNERIRRTLLKKNVTNEQIISIAKLLKKYRMPFLANNMMGLPGETIEEAIETIRLNSRIKTDIPWCSILQPYPNTDIALYALKHGYLDRETLEKSKTFFFHSSILKQPNINTLCNLQKFFILGVKFPWLLPVIKRLIKIKPNKFFDWVFLLTYFSTYKKRHRDGFLRAIFFGLRFRHHFSN